MNVYIYSYNRVGLGPLSANDSEKIRVLRNMNRDFFISGREISNKEQKAWFSKYLVASNDCIFSVFHLKSGKWIGCASIYNINYDKQMAEFGRLMIDGEIVGEKGLGTDTTFCVCRYAFSCLGISRIYLEVFSDNVPALKTYLRSGFKVYGYTKSDNDRKITQMELFKEDD